MKRIVIELGMIVRFTKKIVVEEPDEGSIYFPDLCHKIFEQDDGSGFRESPHDREESYHCYIRDASLKDKTNYTLSRDGVLKKIK